MTGSRIAASAGAAGPAGKSGPAAGRSSSRVAASAGAAGPGSRRFAVAAGVFLAYLVGVILFGAWVRISHSGDGCGSHWPTCGGEIVPVAPSSAALIEYAHRVTSGFAGVLAAALLAWAVVRFRWGLPTRALAATVFFLLVEAGIGAGLVLGGLTGSDDSAARAVVIALHLVNTLALTAGAALAAWSAADPARVLRFRRPRAFGPAVALVIVTAMTGAVTALGDTLLPREAALGAGLFASVAEDFGAGNHFLVRLRAVHPAFALLAAGYVVWLLRPEMRAGGWARLAVAVVIVECAVGAVSVALAAPGWIQIVHLLVAQAFWIAFALAWVSPAGGAAAIRSGASSG